MSFNNTDKVWPNNICRLITLTSDKIQTMATDHNLRNEALSRADPKMRLEVCQTSGIFRESGAQRCPVESRPLMIAKDGVRVLRS